MNNRRAADGRGCTSRRQAPAATPADGSEDRHRTDRVLPHVLVPDRRGAFGRSDVTGTGGAVTCSEQSDQQDGGEDSRDHARSIGPMADETPIAWLALEEGTPIVTSDDEQAGKVTEIVADRAQDIFSGITFRRGLLDKPLFVPADRIDRLTKGAVYLGIPEAELDGLMPYEG